MQIGMMNHPRKSLTAEIDFASQNGFDFLDLTLEPPKARREDVDVNAVKDRLVKYGLGIIGHTPFYLPLDCSYLGVQQQVIEEHQKDLQLFNRLAVSKVTLHFRFTTPNKIFTAQEKLDFWIRAIKGLLPTAEKLGIKIMLENCLMNSERIEIFEEILRTFPQLGFHLDVGHANLNFEKNITPLLLEKFHQRLQHVHLSDNFGGTEDLHLPFYCGNIDWEMIASELKNIHYDDTITLEIFSERSEYLILSKKILEEILGR